MASWTGPIPESTSRLRAAASEARRLAKQASIRAGAVSEYAKRESASWLPSTDEDEK